MKTKPGYTELVDKAGNKISVSDSKAAQLLKKGGWRRADQPPKKPTPTKTGSE